MAVSCWDQAGKLTLCSGNKLLLFAYKESETDDLCQVTYGSPTSFSSSVLQGVAWANALRDVTMAQAGALPT